MQDFCDFLFCFKLFYSYWVSLSWKKCLYHNKCHLPKCNCRLSALSQATLSLHRLNLKYRVRLCFLKIRQNYYLMYICTNFTPYNIISPVLAQIIFIVVHNQIHYWKRNIWRVFEFFWNYNNFLYILNKKSHSNYAFYVL